MAKPVSLDLRFFPAPAGCEECFSAIYRIEIDQQQGETLTDLLLPEWSNLRFISAGSKGEAVLDGQAFGPASSFATGPTSGAIRIAVGGSIRLWGIGLLPLGWARFARGHASRFADTVSDATHHPAFSHFAASAGALAAVEGNDEEEYAVLCRALANQGRAPRDEQRIRAVQRTMADPYLTQISDFAERSGISVRTLERVCLKYFGFSPNVILRRQRLIRSLSAFVNGEDLRWNETIDCHYHDQPHFVREFHNFVGMSPGEYARRDHPVMRAFTSIRQQVWGTPVRVRGQSPEAAG